MHERSQVPPPLSEMLPSDSQTSQALSGQQSTATAPFVIDTSSRKLADGLNRCAQCGSTDIQHKPGTDGLVCLYCRHEWASERIEALWGWGAGIDQIQGTVIASGARDISPDAASLMTFQCSGCGAEVAVNTDKAMTASCHWCRHIFSVNEQVSNGAVPDAVLPFRIPHEEALARIGQFVDQRRFFASKAFLAQFNPENVRGVYLPYMVVDSHFSADLSGYGEIMTREYTQGTDQGRKTLYDADVYRVQRQVSFTVDDLPLESSVERAHLDTRINTHNIINAILPFDTKNAVTWNASYLRGFSSEKRNSQVEQLQQRLEDQLLSMARAQVEASMSRYDRGVRWEQEKLKVHGTRWVSMYLPVWLYAYHQPGPNGGMLHHIAVNGRTGETMGSVPVAHGKLLIAAVTLGIFIEGLVIAALTRAS